MALLLSWHVEIFNVLTGSNSCCLEGSVGSLQSRRSSAVGHDPKERILQDAVQ